MPSTCPCTMWPLRRPVGDSGALQIHDRLRPQFTQVAAAQRLRRDVGAEQAFSRLDRGEADSVDAYARAFDNVPEHRLAADAEAGAGGARLQSFHHAQFFDDSREHGSDAFHQPGLDGELVLARCCAGPHRGRRWRPTAGAGPLLPRPAASAARPGSWARNRSRSCRQSRIRARPSSPCCRPRSSATDTSPAPGSRTRRRKSVRPPWPSRVMIRTPRFSSAR